MAKEVYVFFGAIVGAVAAYVTAKLTSGVQLRLQSQKMTEERVRSEIDLNREKLEKLHLILSKMSLENSLTMSFIQSDKTADIKEYRQRYLNNCERLHQAIAIADLYYPDMSEPIREIYSKSNIFWGHQENLIRIDINKNQASWDANWSKVEEAGTLITSQVRGLQRQISLYGKELNHLINRTGDAGAILE